MSDLLDRQQKFARLLPRLIDKVFELGYACTIGEVERSPAQAAINAAKGIGSPNSLHCARLAIDLHLFDGSKYLSTGDESIFYTLGKFWEELDPDCCWGGRFGDANHFSVTWKGRK